LAFGDGTAVSGDGETLGHGEGPGSESEGDGPVEPVGAGPSDAHGSGVGETVGETDWFGTIGRPSIDAERGLIADDFLSAVPDPAVVLGPVRDPPCNSGVVMDPPTRFCESCPRSRPRAAPTMGVTAWRTPGFTRLSAPNMAAVPNAARTNSARLRPTSVLTRRANHPIQAQTATNRAFRISQIAKILKASLTTISPQVG
jgi:hypothetical protein